MFGNILKELRSMKKLSQEELANIIGVSKSTIGMYEQGNRIPKADATLKRIAEYFDVSIDYLLGLSSSKTIVNSENDSSPNLSHGFKREELEKYGLKPIKTKKFPMLGKIACGEPIYADQDYETYVEASSDINADFCVTAKGDSMINARIFDGDIVFIHSQPDVDNGEIAAVIIEDTVTLKRVYKYPDRLELRPENPMHRVQNYEGEELNQIRILGKAVAFQSYVR